ncbi:MAG TPA: twin-arginine translocase subunit TatC [Firmicutes bacterium]|nr:twin-arginine translocase subunit TatC [Bacillota bacterium]
MAAKKKVNKKKKKPEKKKPARHNSYFDHLEDLRRNILAVLVFFIIAFALCFWKIEIIIHILKMPLEGLNITLHYFKPYEKFLVYIKTAFFAALALSVPFAGIMAGLFVYPALKKGEKKYFFIFLSVLPGLFFAGVFFAYRILVPTALNFFVSFGETGETAEVWGIDAYITFVAAVSLAAGAVFLVPAALLALVRTGIISAAFLERSRLWFILAILILASAITPPDVITQMLLAIPVYFLFEITIIISKLIGKE